jgi:hypothetical protein
MYYFTVFQVLELGCVDNCYVLMTRVKDFHFSDDEVSTEESQVSYIVHAHCIY